MSGTQALSNRPKSTVNTAIKTQLTFTKTANGAIWWMWCSTRRSNMSREESISLAKPLPMWVTKFPTISYDDTTTTASVSSCSVSEQKNRNFLNVKKFTAIKQGSQLESLKTAWSRMLHTHSLHGSTGLTCLTVKFSVTSCPLSLVQFRPKFNQFTFWW